MLNDALKALDPGKVSEVITGSDGFYLLIVDDQRKGDLTLDQVKYDLAMPLARSAWGKEAARRAAIAAVKAAADGNKSLVDLFPATKTGAAPAGVTISDRPVAWMQGDGGSAAPAPTPTAAGAPATPPAPTAPSLMEPTNEQLPTLGPVDAPTVERHDGIVRAGDGTPIGESAELVRALFDQLAVGNVADRIFEVRGSVVDPMPQYALVQVTGKELADVAKFDKEADSRMRQLAEARGAQVYVAWLRERCETLKAAGKIKPSASYLDSTDEQGRRVRSSYEPCESLAAR